MSGRRIAVIGLDGMAWHILDKLFEYDAMPYLESVVEDSLRGILKSTIPPFTPPAWTSIATGVNPGKHGIFDFLVFSENNHSNIRLANSHDVGYPRIHEMLALKGFKVVCINQPLTYPIVKIKGATIISDWISPRLSYYPRSISDYIQSYKPNTPFWKFIKNPKAAVRESLNRANVINKLAQELEWDLFWVIYTEPDHIFHGNYRKIMKTKNAFIEIFQTIDNTIEIVSRKADMILIVSDHGFNEYKYTININSILHNLGLLTTTWRKTTKHLADFLADHAPEIKSVKLPTKLHSFLLRHRFLKSIIKKLYRRVTGRELTAEKPDVDMKLSKAFLLSGSSHGIYVKEHNIIDYIVHELGKIKYIKKVYKREQLFHGPYIKKAPHILVEPYFEKGYTLAGTAKVAPQAVSAGTVYGHHPEGILIAFGRNIPALWLNRPIQTVDIVPTILHYMGMPIPVDTDGTPIPDINYPQKQIKYYDYLKHWQLIRQIQLKKRKLAI